MILLAVSFSVSAQSGNKIKIENKKLQTILNEIKGLQNKLNKKKKLERESINYLNGIEQKILLLNKYLNELKREEGRNSREIKRLNVRIASIEKRIANLKEMYSKYVVWFYKYGRQSKLKLLLNDGSFNDAIVRLKYFKLITSRSKTLLEDLNNSKKELKKLKRNVEEKLKLQKELIAQKKREHGKLLASKKQKKILLAKLRKDKKSIVYRLKIKRQAEKEIEKRIAELVRLENERLAKLKNKKEKERTYNYSNFENFNRLKGRLFWPTDSRKISRKFGRNINPKLKTVSLNYGIDIKARKNSVVRAVAGGVISKIDWLPGYGSVIIITHNNNFRTVYGHVTDITVNEGDRVNAGFVLGHVDDSLEGYVLHFEIWKAKKFQNPSKWLARR